ncbi:hypothetical protein EDB84DRAFT_1265326 [Lactarius hengduanensis]|nr:hypothetical protein EDB84DRAFT_1265326 [Lactarius hengduanensis]
MPIILVNTVSFPILFWLCPTKPLRSLISAQRVTDSGFGEWTQKVQPQNGFIFFNTTQKLQYGAFKSMREGQLDITGLSPFPNKGVALKQPYLSNYSRTSDLSSSAAPILSLSPDEQIKDLAADALSIQWASSLLDDVYDFVALYHQSHVTCPVTIPQFRFVKSGLAITNTPGAAPVQKEAYLVEELIRSEDDGPWKKYINNGSSCPLHFRDFENRRRADFLAFCQHVQYWRTGCQVFTSDFQGGDTLLTDPQIITHPDLGRKLFSKGNVRDTHRNFEEDHQCNVFCKFFEVPTSYEDYIFKQGSSQVRHPFRIFL